MLRRLCDSELYGTFDKGYSDKVVKLMLRALAEELQAWYQYWISIPYLNGILREEITEKFEELAKDELDDHAVLLRERLDQFGADFSEVNNPDKWKRVAEAKFIEPKNQNLVAFLKVNIEAEKEAISTYRELCSLSKSVDPATHSMAKKILSDEEEHLKDLEDFLEDLK